MKNIHITEPFAKMRLETFYIWILFTLILLFMIFGAYLFNVLEHDNDLQLQQEYHSILETFKVKNNISNILMEKFLNTHQRSCQIGIPDKNLNKWDFVGSFYFSGTILTTIGFGNAAPKTPAGKFCCIVYALIGIPLNILFMNLILEKLISTATKFLSAIKTTDNKLLDGKLPLKRLMLLFTIIFIVTALFLALVFAFVEGWSYFEGIYFVFITFSTIGLGDMVPSERSNKHNTHDAYRILNWFLIIIGLVVTYIYFSLITILIKSFLHNMLNHKKFRCINRPTSSTVPSQSYDQVRERNRVSILPNNDAGIGTFSIVQLAIDRMRRKIENNESVADEIDTVESIEEFLREEYIRRHIHHGNSPKAKWRRGAALARIQSKKGTNNKRKVSFTNSVTPCDAVQVHPYKSQNTAIGKKRNRVVKEESYNRNRLNPILPPILTIQESDEESTTFYDTNQNKNMLRMQRFSVETQNTDVTYFRKDSDRSMTVQECVETNCNYITNTAEENYRVTSDEEV